MEKIPPSPSPAEFLVMSYYIPLERLVSGFRKSTGSILQSWAKHFIDQNINALKIAKNSKNNEIFVVL